MLESDREASQFGWDPGNRQAAGKLVFGVLVRRVTLRQVNMDVSVSISSFDYEFSTSLIL